MSFAEALIRTVLAAQEGDGPEQKTDIVERLCSPKGDRGDMLEAAAEIERLRSMDITAFQCNEWHPAYYACIRRKDHGGEHMNDQGKKWLTGLPPRGKIKESAQSRAIADHGEGSSESRDEVLNRLTAEAAESGEYD